MPSRPHQSAFLLVSAQLDRESAAGKFQCFLLSAAYAARLVGFFIFLGAVLSNTLQEHEDFTILLGVANSGTCAIVRRYAQRNNMGLEIERKFLIKDNSWNNEINESVSIRQGYLNSEAERTVRVRVYGKQGFLTIKGKNQHITRKEFEYQIPLDDAMNLLDLCEKPIIEKTRFLLSVGHSTWEIDVFEGENKGLVIAEIELSSEDESFDIPNWLGEEVSSDSKYYNSSLIKKPFVSWRK
ncbi:MAG: adenylate cyclase [Cyclobacteriaceae bacterium]|jgi:adenylate cyclase